MPSPFFSTPERSRLPAARAAARSPRRAFWVGVAFLGAAVGFGGALLRQTESLTDAFLAREAGDFRWVVFLNDHADRSFIEGRLLSNPGVRLARFISKEEALERARRWPALSEGLALTARNPLPESFEIEWDAAMLRPELMGPLSERVAGLDGIADVGYDRSRLERLALLRRLRDEVRFGVNVGLALAGAVLLYWVARLLFWTAAPFPWQDPLWGAGIGALGGVLGGAVAGVWLSSGLDPAALIAAPLVGALAALGRSV